MGRLGWVLAAMAAAVVAVAVALLCLVVPALFGAALLGQGGGASAQDLKVERVECAWAVGGQTGFRGQVRNASDRAYRAVTVRATVAFGPLSNDTDVAVAPDPLGPGQVGTFSGQVGTLGNLSDSRCTAEVASAQRGP
jgi:hypothetical protein